MLALALGVVGCTVGEGTGEVKGSLFILDCNVKDPIDYGDRALPKEYDLQPKFFVAEQLLHLGTTEATTRVNRLLIRLQSSGRRREANDILRFDIPDERAVALCVANQKDEKTGMPEWDPKNCFQGPNGPRLRVAPNGLVRANLTPNFTCAAQIVGTAIASEMAADGNWESWIEFGQFGGAAQGRIGREFKIDIDERLQSTRFALTIEDDAVFTAKIDVLRPPVPDPRIGGTLSGSFDFDMQRGQGAQTFP
jgi:hypothetical protein